MDLREERLKKLKNLLAAGVDVYPGRTARNFTCQQVKDSFEKLQETKIILAGRIRLIRGHGKATFVVLEDFSGKMQLYFRQDNLGEKNYRLFTENLDIGDFLEAEGTLFLTHMGEKTLKVEKWRILTKSILPLPEKWHGLVDVEMRFRQRYLDLVSNKDVKDIFLKRSLIIKFLREFFDQHNFIEVETPILQPIPGGAAAKPFITRHQALDLDLYLRIAPELYLKRLLVGGFEKVYEIARCFRNEGIDWAHNPEFTQIEFYEAFKDYNDFMKLTEELMIFLFEKLSTSTKSYGGSPEALREGGKMDFLINYQGEKINFAPPYPRLSFRDALIQYANFDLEKVRSKSDSDLRSEKKTEKELKKRAKEMGLEILDQWDYGKILDEIFKEKVRNKIINPIFIVDYPIEISPLAKKTLNNPNYVERFQLIIAGLEICNAFSELNDPLEQRERFEKQQKLLERGDEEAQRLDEDFLTCLEYGMPPAAGEGIGIDRLTTILCDVHNIKEVILFPTMRPPK